MPGCPSPVRTTLALLLLATTARAGDVGVDAVHGWSDTFVLASGSAFDDFRDAIRATGRHVIPIDRLDESRLRNLDALVLLQPYERNEAPYSDQDVAAVRAFVERGGGLLALAEAGSGGGAESLASWNRLAAPFGIAFAPEEIEPAGRTFTQLAEHPVTAGVAVAGFDWGRRIAIVAPPAVDLTPGSPREDVLAALDGEGLGGRSVFVGDTSLFMDDGAGSDRPLSFEDNARLLANALAWILEPPHVRALAGNVCAAVGPPVDVLFANDSAGGAARRIALTPWEPIVLFVNSPPGALGPVPFVIYGWTEEASADGVRELPRGVGFTCRPMPFSGADPALRFAWNSWGRPRALGVPRDGTPRAPAILPADLDGSNRPATLFLQGLILDARSPSGVAAVTNGLTLIVR